MFLKLCHPEATAVSSLRDVMFLKLCHPEATAVSSLRDLSEPRDASRSLRRNNRASGSHPHRRPPTAPPKRKNPFQPSGRKGLNQPRRLYKNDFTPAHSSQQNCPNPESPNTHESRPHKSSYRQAPNPLSFRRASEARQEESAVRQQQISRGCSTSRVLCQKWDSPPSPA